MAEQVFIQAHPMKNETSHTAQLRVIREIAEKLTGHGVSFWLFGGWAVDFAANRITREHDDVDFVVWEADIETVDAALESLGHERRTSKHPAHQCNWEKSGVHVQINLIRYAGDGAVVSPGTFEDWPWTNGAFGDCRGEIGELEVPIVSPLGQLEAKQQFPSHPAGRAHREKDIHDIAILKRLVRTSPD